MAVNKYKAKKYYFNGICFDSKKEMNRYVYLSRLVRDGEIRDLELQKKFVLIPTQREPDIIGKRGGVKPGKVIEKEIAYYADFSYTVSKSGETVVEDVKGYRGGGAYALFTVKRKLMLFFYGIRVKEI